MKLIILAGLVAVAVADVSHLFNRPQQTFNRPSLPLAPAPTYRQGSADAGAAILRLDNEIYPEGNYQYAYETQNGIAAQEAGQLKGAGNEAAVVAQGSYQYTSPEGVPVQIQYTADENGYHPVGDLLPTPPPIPEAIARSIQFNAANEQPQQVQYRRF